MESIGEQIGRLLREQVCAQLSDKDQRVLFCSLEDKVLTVQLKGSCAACPSAHLHTQDAVEQVMFAALPGQVEKVVVVQAVSDTLIQFAKSLMKSQGGAR